MKIYVISHKSFNMPVQDPLYRCLAVGEKKDAVKGALRDDTGTHISDKNSKYNELTGMYWIWKNAPEDIVGICHYRRFFVTAEGKLKNLLFHKTCGLLDEKDIRNTLAQYDMIVHNKTYFKECNEKQFCKNLHPVFLQAAQKAIAALTPDYSEAFRQVMQRRYAHLLNMCIADKTVFDAYCQWLFPILFWSEEYLEKEHPELETDRALGMIGERLLDVWILKNQIRIREYFTVNTERVDWKLW